MIVTPQAIKTTLTGGSKLQVLRPEGGELKTTLVPADELTTELSTPAPVTTTLVIGQGPAGRGGSGGGPAEEYETRGAILSDTEVLRGEAPLGTSEGTTNWRIKKLTIVGDDLITTWAEGSSDFNFAWTSKDTYAYL